MGSRDFLEKQKVKSDGPRVSEHFSERRCRLKGPDWWKNRLPALLFVISDSLQGRNPPGIQLAPTAGLPGMEIAVHNMGNQQWSPARRHFPTNPR